MYVVLGADELPCHVPWEGCQNLSSPVDRILGQRNSTGRSGKRCQRSVQWSGSTVYWALNLQCEKNRMAPRPDTQSAGGVVLGAKLPSCCAVVGVIPDCATPGCPVDTVVLGA